MRGKIIGLALIFSFCVSALFGCATQKEEALPQFMSINKEEITEKEFMIYLQEAKINFETIGGYDIWDTDFDGRAASDVAKESALNSLTAVKITSQKAKDFGISLTDDEIKQVEEDAKALSKTYADSGVITEENIMLKVMKDKMLYSKVRQHVVKDYVISEGEYAAYSASYYDSVAKSLREITLKGIFCLTEEEINQVYKKIEDKEDFDSLYNQYNNKDISPTENGMFTLYQRDLEGDWGEFIDAQVGFIGKPAELDEGYGIFKLVSVNENDEAVIMAKLREDYTNSVWQDIFSKELEKWQNASTVYKDAEKWKQIQINS